MTGHAVMPFANGISAKLAARSRHVCAFLGAGASRACGLPDVAGLQTLVLKGLNPEQRTAFESQLAGRNLEAALSRLRRIAVLLDGGDDTVDGLGAAEARALDLAVCRLVVSALDIANADIDPTLRFAAWAARANYHLPVELFTVNYDLLLESALEALGVPYFDGFVGALRARFRVDLVESAPSDADEWLPAFLVRLWKLHGSVHWAWEGGERAEVVRVGAPVADAQPAAIYPSDAKYDESRRVPFVVLQDRLRRALNHPETLMIISGYSFGDAHLNEVLFDAARRRPRSELIALCFDAIPDELVDRALTTPNLQAVGAQEAVLGGVRADWEAPSEAPADLWRDGRLALGDFRHLASFLARSSPPEGELEARLADLLAKAAEGAHA
ncbi:SIR2 family protein [Blastococcus tunisiensis]|uniref:SIR2-like domain-containing protein n=1 Tax=Blastococcus tunisiensis TaxID=1798228 RepID=A0A1I2EKL6_9ACTN|nr:SIR2 family protein [Blastococcus sp. DSM 46838]SFE93008.1 SIR2-like domain-containing protein [Blastococcus sp. DSM 46838]